MTISEEDKEKELEDVLARVARTQESASQAESGFDWRKLVNYVIFGVLGLLLVVNVYNLVNTTSSVDIKGKEAPQFNLEEEARGGEMVMLSEHRGEIVLLDFWATWCPPCKKQMPVIQELHEDESLENLKVLSINTDQRSSTRRTLVRRFLDERNYTFDTLLDSGSTKASYGVTSIPTLVLIGPDGKIQHAASGVHTETELRDLIEAAH